MKPRMFVLEGLNCCTHPSRHWLLHTAINLPQRIEGSFVRRKLNELRLVIEPAQRSIDIISLFIFYLFPTKSGGWRVWREPIPVFVERRGSGPIFAPMRPTSEMWAEQECIANALSIALGEIIIFTQSERSAARLAHQSGDSSYIFSNELNQR